MNFSRLVDAFLDSPKFAKYSPATQKLWGRELMFAARIMGGILSDELRPALVQAYFDGLAGLPGKQAAALAALKQLERWAVVRDLLPRQITLGVEVEESDGGHVPWTEDQVAYAEQHLPPALARAITLGANTGQRGSDLIRMGWTDLEVYGGVEGLNVVQKKTGRQVWVPVTQSLTMAMKTWERRPGPFLTRPDGRPWTRKELTDAWTYQRDSNTLFSNLRACGPKSDRPLVLHGLRGHACVQLVRAGANTRQVADCVGMSEEMVAQYTRLSSQRDNAVAAVINLERVVRERMERKA